MCIPRNTPTTPISLQQHLNGLCLIYSTCKTVRPQAELFIKSSIQIRCRLLVTSSWDRSLTPLQCLRCISPVTQLMPLWVWWGLNSIENATDCPRICLLIEPAKLSLRPTCIKISKTSLNKTVIIMWWLLIQGEGNCSLFLVLLFFQSVGTWMLVNSHTQVCDLVSLFSVSTEIYV